MYVHGELEFVLEGFDLGVLVEQLLLLETDLGLELFDAPDLFLNAGELVPLVGKLGPERVELFLLLFVVDAALGQVGAGEFYFLV